MGIQKPPAVHHHPPKEPVTKEPGKTNSAHFRIPGPSQLACMLQSFGILFPHVRDSVVPEDVKRLLLVFRGTMSLPIAADQAPFILPTSADITPVQELVIDSLKLTFQAVTAPNSKLRSVLPNVFLLLLEFVGYSCRAPNTLFVDPANSASNTNSNCAAWVAQNYVPFAELCLRLVVECYGSTGHLAQVVEAEILTEIIKTLGIPLRLNNACPSQSTWKLAASSLLTVVRVGMPIARQQGKHFRSMWPELADVLEKFLFHKTDGGGVSGDERKKQEWVDCQVVEMIRTEILPFVAHLPNDFVARIIQILNQGSISSADPSDIMGEKTECERAEFSRACFEALLALSRGAAGPDLVTSAHSSSGPSFGIGAISSLLGRCRQVATKFAEDDRTSGEVPMPNQRIGEMHSVLRAVVTMIESLSNSRSRDEGYEELWSELIKLYPCLVDCVSCRDPEIRAALIHSLKAYQKLLKSPHAP